jgi:hypothetical protein
VTETLKISIIKTSRLMLYRETVAVCCKHRTKDAKTPCKYRWADKSLARPTSRCILFDGENISFDASLVIYI